MVKVTADRLPSGGLVFDKSAFQVPARGESAAERATVAMALTMSNFRLARNSIADLLEIPAQPG
jgi:hypothetical protein